MKKMILLMVVVAYQSAYSQAVYDTVKDHKSLPRYVGSEVVRHKIEKSGAIKYGLSPKRDGHWSVLQAHGSETGNVTKVEYEAPEGIGLPGLYQHYGKLLKKTGFKQLYSCLGDDCKDGVYTIGQTLFEGDYIKDASNQLWRGFFDESCYLVVQKKTLNYVVTAVLLASREAGKNVYYRWEICEKENFDLPTGQIKRTLDRDGKIAFYNIYFKDEEAGSVVQAKSKKVIGAIAKYLKDNPKVNVLVVGHTDNGDKFEHNFTRSQVRAESVVEELVNIHEISPARITPFGIGMLAPIATNYTSQGRQKNNRVEIVLR